MRRAYHGPRDVGQSALGFALGELQTVDVLQARFILAHLLSDDQLHAPAEPGTAALFDQKKKKLVEMEN